MHCTAVNHISVANWWWINQHDDECIFDSEVADWVRQMETVTKENSCDEMKSSTEHIKFGHEEKLTEKRKSTVVRNVCFVVVFGFSMKIIKTFARRIT